MGSHIIGDHWAFSMVFPTATAFDPASVAFDMVFVGGTTKNYVAKNDPGFAGYKIWKSAQNKNIGNLHEGMRTVGRYQEQDAIGQHQNIIYKPVKPKFEAQAKMLANNTQETYQPNPGARLTMSDPEVCYTSASCLFPN